MSEAATSSYTPRPGSKTEQAWQALQARGPLSSAELADEIDSDKSTLQALFVVPLREGYLAKYKRDGVIYWRCGDGTPLVKAEPDDDPPVQRIVKAAAAPAKRALRKPTVSKPPRAAARPRKAAPKTKAKVKAMPKARPARAVVLAPAATPVLPDFRFGLFTDGSLVLEQGGQHITLQREQTERLVGWLERLTLKEETPS